jgi:flagellar biosynthesis protein
MSTSMTDDQNAPPRKRLNKAVALEHDLSGDEAPRITATGHGYVADQIVALAFAHGVRVREDADLVEILAALEVDSVIPLEAFTAVAEILSYVYQANATLGKFTPPTGEKP